MAEKSIFQKIIDREIPADIVYEDNLCLAFRDINPQAPTHVLLIPKREIPTLDDLDEDDRALAGHLLMVMPQLARQLGLEGGYRVVANCGPEGGQEVDHLHLHLLVVVHIDPCMLTLSVRDEGVVGEPGIVQGDLQAALDLVVKRIEDGQ